MSDDGQTTTHIDPQYHELPAGNYLPEDKSRQNLLNNNNSTRKAHWFIGQENVVHIWLTYWSGCI